MLKLMEKKDPKVSTELRPLLYEVVSLAKAMKSITHTLVVNMDSSLFAEDIEEICSLGSDYKNVKELADILCSKTEKLSDLIEDFEFVPRGEGGPNHGENHEASD